MSVNTQDIIRIAKDFAKEAYWDLQVAKILFENLKLDTCMNNDKVFYIGRRILYLLQQASEKAVKGYLFAYLRSWIEPMVTTVNKEIGKEDRNKYTEIFTIHEKLNTLNDRLRPKEIGHKPQEVFLNIICDIYEVFHKNKNSAIKYIWYFINKSLQNVTEGISRIIKEYFKKSNKNSLSMLEEIKMITNITINAIADALLNAIKDYLEKLELAEHTRESIERICKEKKIDKPSLPCINEEVLESLKPLKENYYKIRLEIEKQVSKEQVYEHIKKSNIVTQIIELIKAFGIINEDYMMKIIELHAVTLQKYIINIFSSISFSDYLFAYLSKVYPCLEKYEDIGRYPEDITNSKDKICQDIEKLKHILEEVEFLVNTIKAGVETI